MNMENINNTNQAHVIIGYADGASRGNPGPAAIAGILYDESGLELERFSSNIGTTTNNVAEYKAVIELLKRALRYRPQKLIVKSDSELIVRQLNGEYSVRDEKLKELYDRARELAKSFPQISFISVPREENTEADRLCNIALDAVSEQRVRVRGKFVVSVSHKFDCAHKLMNYEGKCGVLHGHTYKVQVAVEGTQLKEGILIDIVELKAYLRNILAEFDHAYLNELTYFKESSPTAENIALVIADKLTDKLPPHVRLREVKVFESEDSVITYELP